MSLHTHRHQVQFYETDLMGIVHHSNYLRIYEEARVSWAHSRGILDYQRPETASHLAVLETTVKHLKPAQFGDWLEVQVQARLEKAKIVFEYKMYCRDRFEGAISSCRTVHASLDKNLKPTRPPEGLKKVLESEQWIEIWL